MGPRTTRKTATNTEWNHQAPSEPGQYWTLDGHTPADVVYVEAFGGKLMYRDREGVFRPVQDFLGRWGPKVPPAAELAKLHAYAQLAAEHAAALIQLQRDQGRLKSAVLVELAGAQASAWLQRFIAVDEGERA
jgi:hypothetical protein